MFSHTTVGSNDVAKAKQFYDAVITVLGHECFFTDKHYVGYGKESDCQFWVVSPIDRNPATVGNGTHIALLAATRDQVDAAYAAAMAAGGSDEGAPGLRPHYHENYYGAYFRDLDGNKLQVVCHKPLSGGT